MLQALQGSGVVLQELNSNKAERQGLVFQVRKKKIKKAKIECTCTHHCRLHSRAVKHLVLEVSESNRNSRKLRAPAVLHYQVPLLPALPCRKPHTWVCLSTYLADILKEMEHKGRGQVRLISVQIGNLKRGSY